MSDDAALRAHLGRILDWEDAHVSFDRRSRDCRRACAA